jgi:hypothetical protein
MLRSCRQVYHKAVGVLYSNHTFSVTSTRLDDINITHEPSGASPAISYASE